jgi:hypothetical protein
VATSTLLSNPVVTVNAVDLSDQCRSLSVSVKATALDATAFGDTSTKKTAGLYDNSVTLELYWSYAATETYATLATLVGTTTNVTWKPASGATSATNPLATLTGTYLEELPPVFTVGELASVTVTFIGGVYSVATS